MIETMSAVTPKVPEYSEQLKQLMSYTTFHIGMYATLCAGLLSLLSSGVMKRHARGFEPFLWWTLGGFLLAGAFGGLVASSIPEYESWSCRVSAPATDAGPRGSL